MKYTKHVVMTQKGRCTKKKMKLSLPHVFRRLQRAMAKLVRSIFAPLKYFFNRFWINMLTLSLSLACLLRTLKQSNYVWFVGVQKPVFHLSVFSEIIYVRRKCVLNVFLPFCLCCRWLVICSLSKFIKMLCIFLHHRVRTFVMWLWHLMLQSSRVFGSALV